MSRNKLRIVAGCAAGIALLTGFLFLLQISGLLVTAYISGVWWIVVSGIVLMRFAEPEKGEIFVTRSAMPLNAVYYLAGSLLFSAVIITASEVSVWRMSTAWFVFVHFFILALAVWHFLVLHAAKEEIEQVEEKVNGKVREWKILSAEIKKILDRADDDDRQAVLKVYEAICYSDPVSHPELNEINEAVKDNIHRLSECEGDVSALCQEILLLIKQRNEMCKLYK